MYTQKDTPRFRSLPYELLLAVIATVQHNGRDEWGNSLILFLVFTLSSEFSAPPLTVRIVLRSTAIYIRTYIYISVYVIREQQLHASICRTTHVATFESHSKRSISPRRLHAHHTSASDGCELLSVPSTCHPRMQKIHSRKPIAVSSVL
jgi:hypothetical protein